MITIKIKNVEEIVTKEKNWIVSKIAPLFVDVESKVEQAIAEELREVFVTKDIKAEIEIIKES